MDIRTRQMAIVIQMKDPTSHLTIDALADMERYLSGRGRYAYIFHDHDKDDEGKPKRNHYHIVLAMSSPVRTTTIIKQLSDVLGESPFAISAMPAYDLARSVQYLSHMNDPEKYQYHPFLDVEYNFDENAYKNLIYDRDEESTFLKITELIQQCDTLTELIYRLGIGLYTKYRAPIQDMWKEKG